MKITAIKALHGTLRFSKVKLKLSLKKSVVLFKNEIDTLGFLFHILIKVSQMYDRQNAIRVRELC